MCHKSMIMSCSARNCRSFETLQVNCHDPLPNHELNVILEKISFKVLCIHSLVHQTVMLLCVNDFEQLNTCKTERFVKLRVAGQPWLPLVLCAAKGLVQEHLTQSSSSKCFKRLLCLVQPWSFLLKNKCVPFLSFFMIFSSELNTKGKGVFVENSSFLLLPMQKEQEGK